MHYSLIRQLFSLLLISTLYFTATVRAAPPALPITTSSVAAEGAEKTADIRQLEMVNAYFNSQFRYIRDRDDRWLQRDQLIQLGGGDCEDFALGKYQTLLEQGFSPSEFHFLYARIPDTGEYHIVLIHHPSGKLLDSLTPETKPLAERPDLQAEFRFTGTTFLPNSREQLSRAELKSLQQWQHYIQQAEMAAR